MRDKQEILRGLPDPLNGETAYLKALIEVLLDIRDKKSVVYTLPAISTDEENYDTHFTKWNSS